MLDSVLQLHYHIVVYLFCIELAMLTLYLVLVLFFKPSILGLYDISYCCMDKAFLTLICSGNFYKGTFTWNRKHVFFNQIEVQKEFT